MLVLQIFFPKIMEYVALDSTEEADDTKQVEEGDTCSGCDINEWVTGCSCNKCHKNVACVGCGKKGCSNCLEW